MAQVQIMKRMAQAMEDREYVQKCDQWLEAGGKVLEEILWAGNYYLNYSDPDNDVVSDLIFGYQLDGEWIVDVHGVPGVFPRSRIDKTLATIRSANCALSQSGATNYASPDGTHIVTVCEGGTVRVWLARDEDIRALAVRRLAELGDFTPEEIDRYGELLSPESIERARRSWATPDTPEP